MKTCVFAGSFDPFTSGHEYVVQKCLEMFDRVVIAVGVNVDKKPMFTDSERLEIINKVYADNERVCVVSFSGMLTDFMKENDIKITVRGLRDQDDFKYENVMARYNQDMFPQIITVYIPTPATLTHVSSSAIRNIIENHGDFSAYLPQKAVSYVKDLLKDNK
ncbi:MAG: pantetheine-phosphate adenylyltransferase [Clostridia bacterium]|nr:pantetheine-phosphate adenylyltransferase [Clostridia bacterium]